MRILQYHIADDCSKMTVERFLRRKGLSVGSIKLLRSWYGAITLDGRVVYATEPLKAGSRLRIAMLEEYKDAEPWYVPIDIVYEDSDYIIYNKPAQLPVHQAHQHQQYTLANAYTAKRIQDVGASTMFHAVNRLDKNTSGLVLCAKHSLSAAIGRDDVEKTYLAVVHGRIDKDGVIDAPIARKEDSAMLREVSDNGKRAVTNYEYLCTDGAYSLVRLHLLTGRTHQIRVHMAHIGHPLAGDDLYGGSRELIDRHALHCDSMSLTNPLTGQMISVSAPLPEDMRRLIDMIDG